ncbi:MAG TPA: thymidylate synthase [Candidatus Nanoarchaeia archaeon]|nr:thymidylate synthase [Candidatus Nanoarchaeia archaeon]
MKAYLDIVKKVLDEGIVRHNRTGTDAITIAGAMFSHEMSSGFPLLTTKSVPFRLVASELEFFLRGISDKKWLQDRDNHIWDEWCSPSIVPYSHDAITKKKMLLERDLGPIYGWQWRHFGAKYVDHKTDYTGQGVDQVKRVVDILKKNPNDRQMLVLAWNPMDINKVIPPFCHYGWQATVLDGRLNLMWNQRSVDVALGLPFNIASYGLLLHLLALETGLKEGKLVGFLGDTHVYTNHITGMKEQLSREPMKLPLIKTNNFKSIFDWKYTDSEVTSYEHHPKIKFEIAV